MVDLDVKMLTVTKDMDYAYLAYFHVRSDVNGQKLYKLWNHNDGEEALYIPILFIYPMFCLC